MPMGGSEAIRRGYHMRNTALQSPIKDEVSFREWKSVFEENVVGHAIEESVINGGQVC